MRVMQRRIILCSGLVAAWLGAGGCDGRLETLLPPRDSGPVDAAGLTLVTRFVHVSDTHVVDEESPARFAGAHMITPSAWRPYEAYSTQLVDGILRATNRTHAAGRTIDFLVHTGDACDNAQANELAWFITLFEGGLLDPRSGPDDRRPDQRPEADRDPHAPFVAQGLYRQGVHGDERSIPWYFVLGNHDVYAIGVFPIFADADGRRFAPLPLDWRPGLLLPTRLDPLADRAYGNVTPAGPGPPCLFETPQPVVPNAGRAYVDKKAFLTAVATSASSPASAWYSVAPRPGLRLVGLDTTEAATKWPGGFYMEGALSAAQVEFLRAELEAATDRGEWVIVATHHPSEALSPALGSAVTGPQFRALLRGHPHVVLHLAGHRHRNRVTDYGGYLEIETCSTLDAPQEGRVIEIWTDDLTDQIVIAYEMFSHLADHVPALGDDPLRPLRQDAHELAQRGRAGTKAAASPTVTGYLRDGRAGVVIIER